MAFGFKKNSIDDQLTQTEQKYTNLAEKYYVENLEWGTLSKKEKQSQIRLIRSKRRELKKDLRLEGITKKADFEFFAKEIGLTYPEESRQGKVAGVLAIFSGFWRWIKLHVTLSTAALLALILLAAMFILAYISEERGHFTVNVTTEMLKNGFQLSEDPEFPKDLTRLFAEEIKNSNATSVYEINRGVMTVDGSNNGPGYMCYTFYIRNNGNETTNYGYTVNILSETLGAGKAAWVMVFENDKQVIYAAPQNEDGKPENLWGYPDAPFTECAMDAEAQYYKDDGLYGIVTTPFLDEYTVMQGFVEDFEPGDVKKYTVMVWLEGDDPDCNNDILGGHVGFNIQFDRINDDEKKVAYFKGLFRTEYERAFNGEDLLLEDLNRDGADRAHVPEDN